MIEAARLVKRLDDGLGGKSNQIGDGFSTQCDQQFEYLLAS